MDASQIASFLAPELAQAFEQIFILIAGFMLVFLFLGFMAGYLLAAIKYRNAS